MAGEGTGSGRDRIFMREAGSFRFFLREVLLRGNCRSAARLDRARKLSYDRSRAAYFLAGYLGVDRGGYRYEAQGDPAWKDRVAGIYELQAMSPRELGGMLELLRDLGERPQSLVALASRRLSGVSEDSYRLYLQGLWEEGILRRERRGGRTFFSLNADVLEGLSLREQRELASLLEWAAAAFPFSSALSSLRQVFLLRCPEAEPLAPVRYRHLQAHPILDELFLWPALEAARAGTVLELRYLRGGEDRREAEPMAVLPLAAVFDLLYGRSYLCCCREEGGPLLTLRFDRIWKLGVTGRAFPPGSPVREEALRRLREELPLAWNISLTGERHRVRLRFREAPGLRYRAENEGRHGAITGTEPGFFLWEAEVTDWLEMKNWILSFGDGCEVLAPESLRREIHAACREVAALYEGRDEDGDEAPVPEL